MPEKQPTRVALSGCGAVSRLYYAPALRQLEAENLLSVTALCDPTPASSAHLHRAFPAAVVVRDPTELLQHSFDLAIIASPPSQHARQTTRLLEAGVSVLCEKPMATSMAEAEAMLEAASSASGVLAIGMLRRFFPATQTIQRILSLNLLGSITSFAFCEGNSFRWPVASPSYFQRQEAGGGVLMDIGAHAVDLMVWWLGEPSEIRYEDDAMGGVEANCRLRCRFSDGAVGSIRLSRDCTLANRYTIRGTKGWVSWRVNEADALELGLDGARFALDGRLQEPLRHEPHPSGWLPAASFEQSVVSQIRNVLAAMKATEPLLVSAREAGRSLSLIERCYLQRTVMPMPWLTGPEMLQAAQLNSRS